jgi:hypothetical protein
MRDISDIYEAVEKLSTVLLLRIENAVRKRGWAGKPHTEHFEVDAPGRQIHPVRISLAMPLGHVVSWLPDEAPGEDQASWRIQIRRSDGVNRMSWSDGLHVRKVDTGYQIFVRDKVLSEVLFNRVLDELAGTGLSGHAHAISKAYASRFGGVPAAVYEVLFSAQHVEQLELMHEAVLIGASELDVETELGRLTKWSPATDD